MVFMESYVGRRVILGNLIVQFKSFTFEHRKNKKGKSEFFLTKYKAIGWSPKHRWYFDLNPYDLWRAFYYFDTAALHANYHNIKEQIKKLDEYGKSMETISTDEGRKH